MKAILQHLIQVVGHWLHGISSAQWEHVLDLVKQAETAGGVGVEKLRWVKDQIATYIASDEGKALFGKLSQLAINWLIESAVSFLKH